MTLTVRDQISKKSSLPAIGDRKRFKLNGHSVLLTLNQLEVERKYDYDPAPGDDHPRRPRCPAKRDADARLDEAHSHADDEQDRQHLIPLSLGERPGQAIVQGERRAGTNGYPRCSICGDLTSPSSAHTGVTGGGMDTPRRHRCQPCDLSVAGGMNLRHDSRLAVAPKSVMRQ